MSSVNVFFLLQYMDINTIMDHPEWKESLVPTLILKQKKTQEIHVYMKTSNIIYKIKNPYQLTYARLIPWIKSFHITHVQLCSKTFKSFNLCHQRWTMSCNWIGSYSDQHYQRHIKACKQDHLKQNISLNISNKKTKSNFS